MNALNGKQWMMLGLVMGLMLPCSGVWADTTLHQPAAEAPSPNVAMLGWANSLGIVEQLQNIYRFSQSASPQALQALVGAMDSPYSLARRKASHSLLEKAPDVTAEDEQKMLVSALAPEMTSTDPVVQKNIVRLIAGLNTPEAQAALRHFFAQSSKPLQQEALEALSTSSNPAPLSVARQFSPFAEIREAASRYLK